MIKVLNIISDTNIGGAGKVLINYAKYRDRADFDMSAAVPVGSMLIEPLREQGVTVYEVDAMADASFDRKAIGKLKLLKGCRSRYCSYAWVSFRKDCGKAVRQENNLYEALRFSDKRLYEARTGKMGKLPDKYALYRPYHRRGRCDAGQSRGERDSCQVHRHNDERN